MSHVICNMVHVICKISHAIWHMLYVHCNMAHITQHAPHFTCLSCKYTNTYHISHIHHHCNIYITSFMLHVFLQPLPASQICKPYLWQMSHTVHEISQMSYVPQHSSATIHVCVQIKKEKKSTYYMPCETTNIPHFPCPIPPFTCLSHPYTPQIKEMQALPSPVLFLLPPSVSLPL